MSHSPFQDMAQKSNQYLSNLLLQSCYVEMQDGTKLAVDVILPKHPKTEQIPACMIQCRYMRGVGVRWPLSTLTNGQPINLIHSETIMRLVAAGFAVVGRWRGAH